MTKQEHEKVLQVVQAVLERNIETRMTIDLATGMYTNIANETGQLIEEKPVSAKKAPRRTVSR